MKFYAITEMKKMEWKSHMIKPVHEIQMGLKTTTAKYFGSSLTAGRSILFYWKNLSFKVTSTYTNSIYLELFCSKSNEDLQGFYSYKDQGKVTWYRNSQKEVCSN